MRPTRIHPQTGQPVTERVVTFKDGPQLLPDHLAPHADRDTYPEMTYQQWVAQVANRRIERAVTAQALSVLRRSHFGL